ncbi:coiled-coil domain-containing protein 81-like [Centruroides vittatus]|uniref:coiled-coil domain-containing protein 81-like n=1 Tax=Centruroides vittatus TaxID=120091 RepID=UPI00351090D2
MAEKTKCNCFPLPQSKCILDEVSDSIPDIIIRSTGMKGSPIDKLITVREIDRVWDEIGKFIYNEMMQQKCVIVPNIGIFNFIYIPLDISQKKKLFTLKPFLTLSERLLNNFGISFTEKRVEDSLPVIRLNFHKVAIQSGCNRVKVDQVYRTIISGLNRCLRERSDIDFNFPHIGVLKFRGIKAKMIFDKKFLDKIEKVEIHTEITIKNFRKEMNLHNSEIQI